HIIHRPWRVSRHPFRVSHQYLPAVLRAGLPASQCPDAVSAPALAASRGSGNLPPGAREDMRMQQIDAMAARLGRAGAVAALAAAVALAGGPALAQSSFEQCAAQADSHSEPGYEDIGRDLAGIDPAAAGAACTAGLAADPGNAQVKGGLARGYYVNGQIDLAVRLFEEAAAAGNLVALSLYGAMLITADGVAQDMARGA